MTDVVIIILKLLLNSTNKNQNLFLFYVSTVFCLSKFYASRVILRDNFVTKREFGGAGNLLFFPKLKSGVIVNFPLLIRKKLSFTTVICPCVENSNFY